MWLPMRSIKAEDDSGLQFAEGSHRDFALPFWYGSRWDLGALLNLLCMS